MLLWIYHSQSCHISHPQATPDTFRVHFGLCISPQWCRDVSSLTRNEQKSLINERDFVSTLARGLAAKENCPHVKTAWSHAPNPNPSIPLGRRARMSQFLQNNGPLWSFKTGSVAADVTESVQRSWAAFPLTSQLSPLSSLFVYEAQRVRRSWHWCLRERSP